MRMLCIGSALSLIEHTRKSEELATTILTQHEDNKIMYSAVDVDNGSKLSFVFEEMHDAELHKDTLSLLWVTRSSNARRGESFLIVRNSEVVPEPHRYTTTRGWHKPSARNMKKIFHRGMMPLTNSQNLATRIPVIRNQDYEYFLQSMKDFEQIAD